MKSPLFLRIFLVALSLCASSPFFAYARSAAPAAFFSIRPAGRTDFRSGNCPDPHLMLSSRPSAIHSCAWPVSVKKFRQRKCCRCWLATCSRRVIRVGRAAVEELSFWSC